MMGGPDTIVAPLFVPADRPERFVRAATSGADAVILDLEDSVAPEAKIQARHNLRGLALNRPVIVRINGVGTAWHQDDCAMLAAQPVAGIMLPKAEQPEDLARLARLAPVIALVETARGLASARLLAESGFAARLAFGSADYAADMGCALTFDALLAARSELVLASRLGGLPGPLDGVTLNFTDPDLVAEEARMASLLGFQGKLLIHPQQVTPVLAAFQPSAQEILWAQRVIASGDGAVAVDGALVDEPVRRRARAILSRAARV